MSKKKVLIANRGEIANRILRTCQALDYETVVIYSDADKDLPYVKAATHAVHIGPAPVAQSYLQADKIVEAAVQHGVDFVHPGYGLLSENTHFAKKCEEAGIGFIGPSADVIQQMGDKITAREVMAAAGVPIVPGTKGEALHIDDACEKAQQIGYPVMLKASAGGGGIGLHVCHTEDDLRKAYTSAKGRAKAYFGQDHMFIEKYIDNPRHIEVQVLGDKHGNVVHLFERDCSVQRRHQKVIEESPSPFLDEETRQKLCTTAVRAAKAVDYVGAGTVEFIMDEDKQFYFLEMNTRLQVEHPVTEQVTGYDLVALQLDVAEGKVLPFTQEHIQSEGHAMEFRIYAEDPTTFMPSPGTITTYLRAKGEGIRYDDAIESGSQITPYYDPMIAKLIVSAPTREEVIKRSKQALNELKIEGIKHNTPFLVNVLENEAFVEGNYTTQFVANLQASKK